MNDGLSRPSYAAGEVQRARSLVGGLRLPADKSVAHRALLFNAMAQGDAEDGPGSGARDGSPEHETDEPGQEPVREPGVTPVPDREPAPVFRSRLNPSVARPKLQPE